MEKAVKSTGEAKKRILAFDILRGFFLVVILVNHIELYPNFFDLFTGRGRLLVSAAEGFFFMSGLLVGMVYKRRITLGMKFIFKKMWKRAFMLYIASVFFTLLFTFLAVHFNHPSIKDGVADSINWPRIVRRSFALLYGFGWADFLSRFAILMLLAPFGFYLLVKNRWKLFIIISLIAWAFRANNFLLSWQIVFFGGMLVGFYWSQLEVKFNDLKPRVRRRIKLSVIWVSALTFLLSYLSVYVLSVLNQRLATLPHSLQTLTYRWNDINEFVWLYAQKWTVGPLRIVLFMFWFAALFMLVRRYENAINKGTKGTLELLGRNSLFVYIAHAFIVFGFKFFVLPGHPLWINFIVTAAALAILIGVTLLYVRIKPRPSAQDFIGDRRQARVKASGRYVGRPELAEY
jgi:hypothetical protein